MAEKIYFTDLSSPEGHVTAIEVKADNMKQTLKELLKPQRLSYGTDEKHKNLCPGVLVQIIKTDGTITLNRIFKTPIWDCKLKDVADFFYTHTLEDIKYYTVGDMGLIVAYANDMQGKPAPPPHEIEEALTEVRDYLGIKKEIRPGLVEALKRQQENKLIN